MVRHPGEVTKVVERVLVLGWPIVLAGVKIPHNKNGNPVTKAAVQGFSIGCFAIFLEAVTGTIDLATET
jgi:hypothetical protein